MREYTICAGLRDVKSISAATPRSPRAFVHFHELGYRGDTVRFQTEAVAGWARRAMAT